MRLELDEITVVVARNGEPFVCYVQSFPNRGARWIYVGSDGTHFNVGLYAGEETIEAITARFAEWWPSRLAF